MAEQLSIAGIGWSATVDLVPLAERDGEAARRAIYGSTHDGGVDEDLTLVHAVAAEITIAALGQKFRWTRASTDDAPAVLALVASAGDDTPMRCAGGSMSLASMNPQRSADERLYAALGIDELEAGRAITVHAEGVTVDGAKTLPWDDPGNADHVVEAGFRADAQGTRVTLTPEMDRLGTGRHRRWLRAWERLARQINPGNPRVRSERKGPAWLTLEVIEPESVPAISWVLGRGRTETFHLGAGAVRVLATEGSPYASKTSRSIMVLQPTDIMIEKDGTHLQIRVGTDLDSGSTASGKTTVPGASLKLTADADAAGGWSESAELSADHLAPDPLGLAARLRAAGSLPQPDSGSRRPDPEALWAAVPLADGWLQLPVPNLTEQLLVDAGMQPDEPPAVGSASSGAVVFGNAAAREPGQHAWALAVNGASRFEGIWRVSVSDGVLKHAELRLEEPGITLEGVVWIATDVATPADALPDHNNWISSVRTEPIYGGGAPGRRYRSVLKFETTLVFEHAANGSAQLGTSEFACAVDETALAALIAEPPDERDGVLPDEREGVLSPSFIVDHPAVAWLHHPTLPVIQALPMTQTMRPANEPAASRSLFPFSDARSGVPWSFDLVGLEAGRWPTVARAQLRPASFWTATRDLPAVLLAAPGVILEPEDDGTATARFRYDIPMLDERAALSAAEGAEPSAAAALNPAAYQDYWNALDEQASLAALEAVSGFELAVSGGVLGNEKTESGAVQLTHLVDATTPEIEASVDLSTYPPQIQVRAAGGLDQAASGNGVLAVPTGSVAVNGGTIDVVSGSVPLRSNGILRDQQGLGRRPSTASGTATHTPALRTTSDGDEEFDLVAVTSPIELSVGQGRTGWKLWFRDVPCRSGPAGTARFDRAATPVMFTGYEWRLGRGTSMSGLDFLPLQLESLEMERDKVVAVALVGRLQLPLSSTDEEPVELDGLANAVRVSFSTDGAGLQLTGLDLVDPDGTLVWPLRLVDGEVGGAPMIVWNHLELRDGSVTIGHGDRGPRLDFFAFDNLWRVQLEERLEFPAALDSSQPILHELPDSGDTGRDSASGVRATHVELDLAASGAHAAGLLLEFDAGGDISLDLRVELMEQELQAAVRTLSLFGIDIRDADVTITGSSLQASWTGLAGWDPDAAESVQVIAGFPVVSPGLPGYVGFTFETTAGADGTHRFVVTHALAEAVMHGAATAPTGDGTSLQLCSGAVVLGYLARMDDRDSAWHRSVEVSGWIDLLGHQTHPSVVLGEENTLPVPILDDPVEHLYHRARILLSGHKLPISDGVAPGLQIDRSSAETRVLWSIHGPLELWAVVEHSLGPAQGPQRRFTVTQPVRFSSAADVAETVRQRVEADGYRHMGAGGFAHPDAAPVALTALEAVDPDVTLVTLDAAIWVDTTPLAAGAAPITIRRLPLGRQGALLADPADYRRGGAATRVLMELPFLGTLAKSSGDRPFMAHPTELFDSGDQATREYAALMTGHALQPHDPLTLSEIDRTTGRSVLRVDNMLEATNLTQDATDGVGDRLAVDLESVVMVQANGPEGRGTGNRFATASLPIPSNSWLALAASTGGAQELPGDSVTEFDFSAGPDALKHNLGRESRAHMKLRGAGWEWSDGEGVVVGDAASTAHAEITRNHPRPSFTVVSVVTPAGSGRVMMVAIEGSGELSELIAIDIHGSKLSVRVAGSTFVGNIPDRDRPTVVVFTSDPPPRGAGSYRWGTLYIDGILAEEGRHSVFRWAARGRKTYLRLGAPSPFGSMLGTHHRIAVFDRLLIEGEIAAYSAPPPTGPLDAALALASRIRSELFDLDAADSTHAAIAVVPTASDARMVVGPYLALDLTRSDPAGATIEAESVELVAVGQVRGSGRRLRPIASQLVDHSDALPLATPDSGLAGIEPWARAVLERHAHSSPLAIVRRRQVLTGQAGEVLVAYAFGTVRPPRAVTRIGWRGHPLRAEPSELIFREPQFGGRDVPVELKPIDVAPPLVTGVQPVRDEELKWSGLRITTRYGDIDAPQPSGVGETWEDARWHALQQRVRFRTSAESQPKYFGAPPRQAAAATASAPLLPAVDGAVNGNGTSGGASGNGGHGWRPIVPDAIRQLLSGNRPGAILELRSQLLKLTGTSPNRGGAAPALPTGSVPVTHRVPRPLPLPAGEQIVSGGAGGLPVSVSSSPLDVAHFEMGDGQSALYRLEVTGPPNGTINAEVDHWEGFSLRAAVEGSQALPLLPDRVSITDGSNRLSLRPTSTDEGPLNGGSTANIRAGDIEGQDGATLRFLQGVSPGAEVRLEVAYRGPETARFVRELTFPMRVAAGQHLPLVQSPRFIRFEDPTYNRALATQAARAAGQGTDGTEFVLTADRATYGPGSQLVIGVTPDTRTEVTVELFRVTPAGLKTKLATSPGESLRMVSMAELAVDFQWEEGDRIEVVMSQDEVPIATLNLAVIARDPNPAPSSAYALLRTQGEAGAVHCVRYAVGPRPAKVELVDPFDVFTGIVRRRAIFAWQDTVRANQTDVQYYVQKTTSGGSTHVPELDDFQGEIEIAGNGTTSD